MVRMNLKWTKLKKFNHIFFKETAMQGELVISDDDLDQRRPQLSLPLNSLIIYQRTFFTWLVHYMSKFKVPCIFRRFIQI